MSETIRRVIQNSLLRLAGYAVGAGLHFGIIVLIGRYLGTTGFGHFSFILAFVGIFQLLTDMGVRNVLIRDIAIDREYFAKRLGVARTLMWILAAISMGCIVLLAHLLTLTDEVRQATYLAGLAVILTFYGLSYSAVLRAFEEMEWDILGFVLHKVIFMGCIWLVLNTDWGLRGVFGAMLAANGCQYLYYWALVRVRHGRARLSFDVHAGWALFVDAIPLGIAEVLRRLTWQVDKLLLAALGTPVAVGLFSAAYKFLEAMNPFTVNLTLPLFPVFSRLARISSSKLFDAYEQSLKFLYAMGFPVGVILFVLSDRIVPLLFGAAYRDASQVLSILAPVVILLLPTSVYGYIFTALGRQRLYMGCAVAALVTNIGLDLLLIPTYGYIGAAAGTLVAEAVLFLSGLLMLQRLGSPVAGMKLIWRPLLASLALGGCCWLAQDMALAGVLVGVVGGLAAYASVLLLLQTFTQQEMALMMDAMRLRLGSVTR
jgi:O-antigen/teichoic acid export membrane protein